MRRFSTPSTRTFLILFLFLSGVTCTDRSRTGREKNVLLLVVDTLRADHLGHFGYPRDTSPCLDRLSDRSVVFSNVISQAPWTNPSIVSLFTSLYPTTHNLLTVRSDGRLQTLSENIITLTQILKSSGFRTAAFTANPWLFAGLGIERGFDLYKNLPIETRASSLNQLALEWLRTGHESDLPYFLYIHYMDVHGPYQPPAPYDTIFQTSNSAPRVLSETDLDRIPEYLRLEGVTTLDEYVSRYDGGIRYWDECLASMIESLTSEGYLENTILIITADHGEEFLEHGGFNHGSTLYQEQIHVPLIWYFPESPVHPRTIGKPAELLDVMPTLLAQLGKDIPDFLQGDDMTPSMLGDEQAERPVFSEGTAAFGGLAPANGAFKAVRIGNRKLILNEDTGRKLFFDLEHDPDEKAGGTDAESDAQKEIVSILEEWMERNRMAGTTYKTGEKEIEEDLERKLEALGYIDRE